MSEQQKLTPLLEQYFKIKDAHKDALLLFQVGDFYELFFDDAKTASQALSITLTKRGKCLGEDIPICGVPVSSLSYHLIKLVKQGYKVAICDQVSKPIPGEIVDRKVSRVLTPGTLTDDLMLDQKKASYLCTIWPIGSEWSLMFTELLSAKVFATVFKKNHIKTLESEMARFFPDEILLPALEDALFIKEMLIKKGFYVNTTNPLTETEAPSKNTDESFSLYSNQILKSFITNHCKENILHDCQTNHPIAFCFGVLTSYLHKYHANFIPLIERIDFYQPDDYLVLDAVTIKNLEIFKNNYDGNSCGSLFSVIDKCKTSMGSRALRQALMFPLQNVNIINMRLEVIRILKQSYIALRHLSDQLAQLCDLERVIGRIALGKAVHQDFILLRESLNVYQKIQQYFLTLPNTLFSTTFIKTLPDVSDILELLNASLEDLGQDNKIKKGFDLELDTIREFIKTSHNEILSLEQREIARNNIQGLRIKYTDIHGYFYEINFKDIANVPTDYKLLQSLAGRSRFTNENLKALEFKIINMQTELDTAESNVFLRVSSIVQNKTADLRKIAHTMGQLDMLYGLAQISYDFNLTEPLFIEKNCLLISKGRHLVVEVLQNFNFVANDTIFDDTTKLMILTGPNMGGKSTYLRQVAHIVLLAHIGSFVPASNCTLSVVDRIFTRIGSADHLAAGKSTFLVEMEEVALICNAATKKSLIVLDEVGRGTSTFDGMAIAWAILEYLYHQVNAKTLFATHYHELTELSTTEPGIKNFFMACNEKNDTITFMHSLTPGVAKSSFGICIAKLAGLPPSILTAAKNKLLVFNLKKKAPGNKEFRSATTTVSNTELLIENELQTRLSGINLDDISFREAYNLLEELKSSIKNFNS